MSSIRKQLWWVVAVLTVVVAVFAPSAEAGDRVVVTLDEPFEVNGEVFPGGQLTFREVRDYSPIATLNEVWVGDHCIGMLMAQQTSEPTRGTRDELIFARGTAGHLVLQAVSLRGQPTRELFEFHTGSDGGSWQGPVARLERERPLMARAD